MLLSHRLCSIQDEDIELIKFIDAVLRTRALGEICCLIMW